MEALLLFPHQLFHPRYFPRAYSTIWLAEDPLFFYDPVHAPSFHKQKLILHRASLRRYAEALEAEGFRVEYWPYNQLTQKGASTALHTLLSNAYKSGISRLHVFEPVDYLLERRLARAAQKTGIELHIWDTPAFLTTRQENAAFQAREPRYHQTTYYIWQRKRLNLLLMPEGAPLGGRWTYDVENRKKLPSHHKVPLPRLVEANDFVREAEIYVEKHFPHAWGASGPWWLPTSHEEALQWLEDFLLHRLANFGPYEDAFEPHEPFLYHSVLSPLLNIGLLTPQEVIQRTLQYAETVSIPIASLEGFVRQIIGWREYIRMVYDQLGTTLRKSNLWQHTQPFPEGWESGNTGILPVDTTLRRLYRWGYTHHIERLMVLGSFLFLNEVHPDRVYQFFMRSYVDAYDWVMVPNVYGMSQHASSLITTKPYFSGSRYLRSLSHYPEGAWVEKWDELFWGWVRRHRAQLVEYPRLLPLLQNPKAKAG
ncbi:MAG: cryptochrome/photolyase family protein [Bacteroidia bacterium]|nr:cryptochrome/photolyase family protein [Bacteroidia bacterium]